MSFSGNVTTMPLEEVFGFLAGNHLEGELVVQSGDEVSVRLYFDEGQLFFPFSARRGTYSLGKILRHTGVLSREGLESALEAMRQRKKALAAQEEESEEVKQAQRLQYTEEIQDLFLWGNARFEFQPGPWPPRVQADREAGRGLLTDVTGLLMEVARRADERARIRRVIPSSRVVLATAEGAEEAVVGALTAKGIEVTASPFDGLHDLDEHLGAWGIPHHDALAEVALLVEAGHLLPVSPDETRSRLRDLLASDDLLPAARLLGHWVELSEQKGERFALGLEQEFVTSAAFTSGAEEVSNLRLDGGRLFTLVRVLASVGTPSTLILHHRGWEKRLAILPGELYVRNERRKELPTPPLVDYLVKRKLVTKDEAKRRRKEKDPDAGLDGRVDAAALQEARVDRLLDELAELAFWGRAEVEIRNRAAKGPEGGRGTFSVALGAADRERLVTGLDDWAQVFDKVPSQHCVFIPGLFAESKDPAARFFKRFDLTQNFGELRRKAQARPLDFARFVARGIGEAYVRPPSAEELEQAFGEAEQAGNDVMCYRLALAGVAFGFGAAFAQRVERFRREEAALPTSFPALEGDLDGVGLAAVLQALRSQRRTGTLAVTAGPREEKLFFYRGDAFILRIEDAEAEEFVAFFLGDDGADSMSELGSGLTSRGLVDESDLTEAEMQDLKDKFLEVLFWDGSTFAFFQNALPDEFFNAGDGVSKIALHTDRFLMESMQLMAEWEGLSEAFQGDSAILEFTAPEAKLTAIRDRGHPEILTLIDGRLSFKDLVRISGAQRLEVARLCASLVEEEALRVAGHQAAAGEEPGPPLG